MAWKHTQSAHQRGYGQRWRKARAAVLVRDLGLCQPCFGMGRTTPAQEVDHILNKASGGTDHPDNLQAICPACHADKTAEEAKGHVGNLPTLDASGWPTDAPVAARPTGPGTSGSPVEALGGVQGHHPAWEAQDATQEAAQGPGGGSISGAFGSGPAVGSDPF